MSDSFLSLCWNIEEFGRNILNLKSLVNTYSPDIIFLSEPQIYSCDVQQVMKYLIGDYCYYLNSHDKFDPSLPLTRSKAHGGTMALWKQRYDPYITVKTSLITSASFLPLVFHPPDIASSIHVCVYLPTNNGQDQSFINEISYLSTCLQLLREEYPGTSIYLRGDFNVSKKNSARTKIFNSFMYNENLVEIDINHPTYHHFTGQGFSDSHLDRLLIYSADRFTEALHAVICKLDNLEINSHHDALLSLWTTPLNTYEQQVPSMVIAPKIDNHRHRVCWTNDGIESYQEIVLPQLQRLQELYLSSCPSKSAMSLLLEATNDILITCAQATNKYFPLKPNPVSKSRQVPRPITLSHRKLKKMWKQLLKLRASCNADEPKLVKFQESYTEAKRLHRKLVRSFKVKDSVERDSKLLKDPRATFADIRRAKQAKIGSIGKLQVENRTYLGDHVQDGFYEAVSTLKSKNMDKAK